MAWRLVQQPDGLFARFSDVVDDFTHVNYSEKEALEEWGSLKVAGALKDDVWGKVEESDGLNRWRDSMNTRKLIHGETNDPRDYMPEHIDA